MYSFSIWDDDTIFNNILTESNKRTDINWLKLLWKSCAKNFTHNNYSNNRKVTLLD